MEFAREVALGPQGIEHCKTQKDKDATTVLLTFVVGAQG